MMNSVSSCAVESSCCAFRILSSCEIVRIGHARGSVSRPIVSFDESLALSLMSCIVSAGMRICLVPVWASHAMDIARRRPPAPGRKAGGYNCFKPKMMDFCCQSRFAGSEPCRRKVFADVQTYYPDTRDACVARDLSDPLRAFRDRFALPDGVIYLDGNSLGPMPRAAPDVLNRTITQEWGHDLIGSWNSAGWFDMPVRLGDRIGKLIGRRGRTNRGLRHHVDQFVQGAACRDRACGRTATWSSPKPPRFPTDLYIIEGAINSAGRPMQRRLIGADGTLDRGTARSTASPSSCCRMWTIAPAPFSTWRR